MRTKHQIKENQARRRLLRYALFTLGGAGLEGSALAREDDAESDRRKADSLAA